jgi:hypothetical protein
VLWTIAIAAAAGFVALGSALLATPAAYSPADPASPDARMLGEATENAVARAVSRVRPAAVDGPADGYASEPWELTLDESQLNAGLGARLPQWLVSRNAAMPAGLSSPAVRVEPGRLTLAATCDTMLGGVVLSQVLEVHGQTPPRLTPRGWRAGVVRMPFEGPLAGLGLDRRLEDIAKPIRLEDGRAVEILSIEATESTLVVRCRTVKR